MDENKYAMWILRIAMFGTFFGHGIFAIQQKTRFLELLTAMTGGIVQGATAGTVMLWIGIMDILVALIVLVRPVRVVLVWGTLWALATAIARPVGGDPIWDFVERSANFGVPLALLFLRGFPTTVREWFT